MGQTLPYIMGGVQTVGGLGATVLGQPEIGVPLLMSGIGTMAGGGIGQAAGGKKGEAIGSTAGGLLGGLGGGGLEGTGLGGGLSSLLGGGSSGGESTPSLLSSLFGSATNANNPANAGAFGINPTTNQNLSGSGPLSFLKNMLGMGGGTPPQASMGGIVPPGTGGAPNISSADLPPGINPNQVTGVSTNQVPAQSNTPSTLSQLGSVLGTAAPYASAASNLLKQQQAAPPSPPQIPSRSGAATQMQAPQPPTQGAPMPSGAGGGGGNQQQLAQILSLILGMGGGGMPGQG